MIFVDTSAWAALFVLDDPLNTTARDFCEQNQDTLLTSDYVLDELLTLLQTRFTLQAAIRAGQSLWSGRPCALVYLTPKDIEQAWEIFRSHRDKGWSFTDCTSLAVMQRLHVSSAFAFDRHFSQMRGIRRIPI
jgi:predicted nucleic acid-binding protein